MADKKSNIERLQDRLYSRSAQGLGAQDRRPLREEAYEVEDRWEPEKPYEPLEPLAHVKKPAVLRKLLVISIIFFMGALLVGGFFIIRGTNVVSVDNVQIEIQGPASVGGGEELPLQIAITNRNSVSLASATLIVEYPEGTRSSADLDEEFRRYREPLGDLAPGTTIQRTVRAVLFGPEGEEKTVKVSVEYRVENSNALFYQDQLYDVVLSSSAMSLRVDSFSEVSSGQEIEFTLTVGSNSNTIIENVLLTAEYPFGFQFSSAEPRPVTRTNVWSLGDLEPEGKKIIKIRGTLTGEDSEERIFHFYAGVEKEDIENELKAAFATAVHEVLIQRPFLGVAMALDGSTAAEYAAPAGERVRADISWANNLTDQIVDGEIIVKLSGNALDRNTITASRGFYRSVDNSIIWSGETLSDLRVISPGSRGSVSFTFASPSPEQVNTLRNPEVDIEVDIRGQRVSERNVPEAINSSISRSVKFESDLALSSRTLFRDGPFENTGPLPPKAEQETTYTVILSLENSVNTVSDARVTATLPSYVRWVGRLSPSSAQVSFNPVGGQVTWDVGTLAAGGGTREAAFQVAFLPSLSQVGQSAVLVNAQKVTGYDTFTGSTLADTSSALSTQLPLDSGFQGREGIVVE